ncbi:hypothetical protein B5J92_04510 [Moraxella atlantae]|nr:hypothetical protein B5J92_04510 [Moraxella atlantae]
MSKIIKKAYLYYTNYKDYRGSESLDTKGLESVKTYKVVKIASQIGEYRLAVWIKLPSKLLGLMYRLLVFFY